MMMMLLMMMMMMMLLMMMMMMMIITISIYLSLGNVRAPIHRPAPLFTEQGKSQEILVTGIKVC
jgi:F0F1-type ATP synthase beta subunit